MKLLSIAVIIAVLALAALIISQPSVSAAPACPSDWPEVDRQAPVINELWHRDGDGNQWVVFGNPPVLRAYPADARYARGYAVLAPHETCYWNTAREAQIEFREEQEDPQSSPDAAAAIPPKSDPAAYTRHFVDDAIRRYRTQGLEATLAYYNREESIDGSWYVFIIDGNGIVIAHPEPGRVGLDLNGWVGTDAVGYNFGPEILAADENGRWVSYLFRNPERGGLGPDDGAPLEYKHVWAVRHDGLVFASGWYVSAEEFTRFLVGEAIARYDARGLEATVASSRDPDDVSAQWYLFIATPEGEVLGHYNAGELIAQLEALLRGGTVRATAEGVWIDRHGVNPTTGEALALRFWLVAHDGLEFGAGWHHDASGN